MFTWHRFESHLCIVPPQVLADLQMEVLQVEVCRVTKFVGAALLGTKGRIILALLPSQLVAAPFWILPEAISTAIGDREGATCVSLGDPWFARGGPASATEPEAATTACWAPAEQ